VWSSESVAIPMTEPVPGGDTTDPLDTAFMRYFAEGLFPDPRKVIEVAADELDRLRARVTELETEAARAWDLFDTAKSASLLAGIDPASTRPAPAGTRINDGWPSGRQHGQADLAARRETAMQTLLRDAQPSLWPLAV
jgi:hypothetical protein